MIKGQKVKENNMSNYVISCCSTADLTREHMLERNIKYACFHYELDGKEYMDDLGQSMPLPDFYKAMEAGAMTKTSQINQGEYIEYFRQFLDEGYDVLHCTLSSGISGTVNSARLAKEALEEEYPDRKIYVIDSLAASSGFGLLMAEWKEQGKEISYDCAIAEATASDIRSVIDVDDSAFCNPDHMEESIIKYCHKHHLRTPVSQGEFVRCVIESLAYRYKLGVEQMNRCLPAPVKQLHIIGGGCQNRLLNQLTANALGIPVYAGPVEATAIGNILVQAKAQGEVDSWEELKEIIINSVEPQVYYPE